MNVKKFLNTAILVPFTNFIANTATVTASHTIKEIGKHDAVTAAGRKMR